MTSIKFQTAKNGQLRAYQYNWGAMRWVATNLESAKFLVLSGAAELVVA